MIQALHAILGDANSRTKVTMLYGSKVSTDILGCELLHKWAADHADRFQVIDVLSHEPTAEEGSDWKGERGFVNRQRIEEHFLPANTTDGKLIIFVCGPPPMYNALCGPREEKEVTGVLGEVGYSTEQVFKF
jgi:cytochrome-b5 reductase